MARDNSFHDYLMFDIFSQIDGISSKKMFGGYGFYKDGIIFAILPDDKVYFKVDETNRKEYESYRSQPFTYPMKNGRTTTLSFWELPPDILEDHDELPKWIEKSVVVSIQSKKKKK